MYHRGALWSNLLETFRQDNLHNQWSRLKMLAEGFWVRDATYHMFDLQERFEWRWLVSVWSFPLNCDGGRKTKFVLWRDDRIWTGGEMLILRRKARSWCYFGGCAKWVLLGRKETRAGEFQKRGALGRNRRCLLKNIMCGRRGQIGRLK
jgi:hypothetical protein